MTTKKHEGAAARSRQMATAYEQLAAVITEDDRFAVLREMEIERCARLVAEYNDDADFEMGKALHVTAETYGVMRGGRVVCQNRVIIGREAECAKCGETFNPSDDDDLEHITRMDGNDCGGLGVMKGAWGR